MNKDQIKGATQQVKGKANEVAGKVTGNKAHELKGDLQQVAGRTQRTWGGAKERVKKGS